MRDFDGSNSAGQPRVTILGGSAEARVLADHLGDRARLWLPAKDRLSGQGASGPAGLSEAMQTAQALVVAPHPCDVDTLALGARLAAQADLPCVTLTRPQWRPTRRDRWIILRSVRDAASALPAGSRVLVTLGRQALPDLRALRHAHLFVRQLTRHSEPFPMRYGTFLHDIAPFTVAQEIRQMRRFRIDAVLTRNAGGPGGWPKIAAARALGLPVYMVARPRIMSGPVVASVEAALNWIGERVWLDA